MLMFTAIPEPPVKVTPKVTLVISKATLTTWVYESTPGIRCAMGHFAAAVGALVKTDDGASTIDMVPMMELGFDPGVMISILFANDRGDLATVTELFALAGHSVTFVD